jgi:hypothetical protein
METGKRIISPTPVFWKGIQRKLTLILSIVAGVHIAVANDQLPFLIPYTQVFVILEIVLPALIGQAQLTKK